MQTERDIRISRPGAGISSIERRYPVQVRPTFVRLPRRQVAAA